MDNAITQQALVDTLARYFLPKLLSCEDLDCFEGIVQADIRTLASRAMIQCLESFDHLVKNHVPRSWSVHEIKARTIITLVGTLKYHRTIFLDEYGRRRALTDELLGIPKYTRLSAGAFLWLVKYASEQSYRKTARAFGEMSGVAISHITVMNCVHKEGALLRDSVCPSGKKISQDTLFLEVDGLWVHLQAEKHRECALPRFLYEQAKKTTSFELKMAAVYAGKKKVAPGRYERGGLVITCSKEKADKFWDDVIKMIGETYELSDIENLWLGADGGNWCGPERIEPYLHEKTQISCSLDPFHIMQKICKAFPEGNRRDWAVNLAIRTKATQLAQMCERIAPKITDGRHCERVHDLETYMKNNATAVIFPKPSMGTIEGTNAHVGAARLKGQGRSWSRTGAEAMCLVRCALKMGKPLIPPQKDALFSATEQQAILRSCAKSASEIPKSSGHGYQPPHCASTSKMKTNAGFRACVC